MAWALNALLLFEIGTFCFAAVWAGTSVIVWSFTRRTPIRHIAAALGTMLVCLLVARWLYHLSGGAL